MGHFTVGLASRTCLSCLSWSILDTWPNQGSCDLSIRRSVWTFSALRFSQLLTLSRSITPGVYWGGQGRHKPRAPNRWRAQKSHNNVASFSFNRVHSFPKGLRFKHGGAKLISCSGCRYALMSHCGLFAKTESLPFAPEIIFFRSLLKIHDNR